jgi:hypothetical protein
MAGQWVYVPTGSTILVTPSPSYPAVGGPDDMTDVLDHWADTRTGSCTVIDVQANTIRGTE